MSRATAGLQAARRRAGQIQLVYSSYNELAQHFQEVLSLVCLSPLVGLPPAVGRGGGGARARAGGGGEGAWLTRALPYPPTHAAK